MDHERRLASDLLRKPDSEVTDFIDTQIVANVKRNKLARLLEGKQY